SILIFSSVVFTLILLTIHISSKNIESTFSHNRNLDKFSLTQKLYNLKKIEKETIKIDEIPISKRKSDFILKMLPIVQEVNKKILSKRERIFLIEKRLKTNSLSVLDADSLKRLFREYNVKNNDFKELKSRTDIIPISLTIAQAAIESGWGTSRFALKGNAFFGQKIVGSNGNGIKPIENKNPLVKVRSFNTLKDSVYAYAKNLNTHNAYKKFRQVRREQRSLSQTLDGHNLAKTLKNYSELGKPYITKVQSIIKGNNLGRFDYLEYQSAQR
ncbi:MAG: hypothetical protein CFH24_00671, partial [Alphaproteobacteria bacterium MarineAlpha6_Bin2]